MKEWLRFRFKNLVGFSLSHYFHYFKILPALNTVVKKHFGPDFELLEDTVIRSSLVLVNSEELLDFPRPILHKVLYIGGIGLSEPGKLNQEWSQLVNESKDGVVIFSFGSIANASAMPDSWKVRVFD